MHPACWVQFTRKRHFLYLRIPCYHLKYFHIFLNCLTLLDVFGFNGSETVKGGGGAMSTQWQQHAWDWRWMLCEAKRNRGEKEVLENPTETKHCSLVWLIWMHLPWATRNWIYEATLKCNRMGYADSAPPHYPPPNPNTGHRCQISFWILLINHSSCISHPEHSIIKWGFYLLSIFVCPLK